MRLPLSCYCRRAGAELAGAWRADEGDYRNDYPDEEDADEVGTWRGARGGGEGEWTDSDEEGEGGDEGDGSDWSD